MILTAGALFTSACRTASISKSLENIPIPANLDQTEAKAAVIYAISNKPLPEVSNWQKIVAGALASQGFGDGLNSGLWFIESVEANAVTYGFKDDEYYLRIKLTIAGGEVVPKIDGSKNLNQHKDRIHKAALEWTDSLCVAVRAMLGNFSRIKAGYQNDK
ncbi:MAG: hypothetical protein QM790_08295 [Nibricoccus sp.]